MKKDKKVIYVKHESEVVQLDTKDGFIPFGGNYRIEKHPEVSCEDFYKGKK